MIVYKISGLFPDFLLTKFQFFLADEQQSIGFCMVSTTPRSHQYA